MSTCNPPSTAVGLGVPTLDFPMRTQAQGSREDLHLLNAAERLNPTQLASLPHLSTCALICEQPSVLHSFPCYKGKPVSPLLNLGWICDPGDWHGVMEAGSVHQEAL